MSRRSICLALVSMIGLLAAVSCDRNDNSPPGSNVGPNSSANDSAAAHNAAVNANAAAVQTGQAIDSAAHSAGDAIKVVADKTGDAVNAGVKAFDNSTTRPAQ